MTERVFQQVPLHEFVHWMARGWRIRGEAVYTHHDIWSVLMERVDG